MNQEKLQVLAIELCGYDSFIYSSCNREILPSIFSKVVYVNQLLNKLIEKIQLINPDHSIVLLFQSGNLLLLKLPDSKQPLENIQETIGEFNHNILTLLANQLYFSYGSASISEDGIIPYLELKRQIHNRNLTRYTEADLDLLDSPISPSDISDHPLLPEKSAIDILPKYEFVGILQATVVDLDDLIARQTCTQMIAIQEELAKCFHDSIPPLIKKREGNIQRLNQSPKDFSMVGSWKDIVELGIDLQKKFHESVTLPLSLSVRIKLVGIEFPIQLFLATPFTPTQKNSISFEGFTAESLEENFDYTFVWETVESEILGEKYNLISDFCATLTSSASHIFISYLISLCEFSKTQKINIARLAYYLALHKPSQNAEEKTQSLYSTISRDIFRWLGNEKDFQEFILALSMIRLDNYTKEEK